MFNGARFLFLYVLFYSFILQKTFEHILCVVDRAENKLAKIPVLVELIF